VLYRQDDKNAGRSYKAKSQGSQEVPAELVHESFGHEQIAFQSKVNL